MWKLALTSFGLSVSLDLGLAFLWSRFADYDQASVFWFIFLFLIFAPLVLGFWGIIKSWIWYFPITKKVQVQFFLKELRSNQFPDPLGETDASVYLHAVANRNDLPKGLRMKALQMWAELEATKKKDGFGNGLMTALSAGYALEEYDKRFAPKRAEPDDFEEE